MRTNPVHQVPAALAHAFGERYDSPVPLALFVLGGAAVVLASFALVYRTEVAQPTAAGAAVANPEDDVTVAAPRRLLPGLSVVLLVLLALAGLVGSQEVAENILPVSFWIVVWVVAPLAVGLVGDFTAPVNPFAAIARATDREGLRRSVLGGPVLDWPRRLGYWGFALLYLLVVFGELVVNSTATVPRVIAVALVTYGMVCAAGGLVFGAAAWNRHAELFTMLFATWGRLGWFRFGARGRRGLGGGLTAPFDPSLGRLAGVLLLLVSVSFDGVLSTPQWARLLGGLPAGLQSGTAGYVVLATAVLVGLTVVMLAVFGGFATASARAGGFAGARPGAPRGPALNGMLPSLLPIAFAYLLAHYLQYVLVNGQLLLPLIGNPVGSASWPIHLPYPFADSYEVDAGIMPTSVVWYVQIVVIVVAHVLAVVLAHRHLGSQAPDVARARRSEWPWLVAMVGYTMLSLWLLAQPLQAEAEPAGAAAGTAPAGVVR
jgi:hypothetical protein